MFWFQRRRDKRAAARRLLHKLLKKQTRAPRLMIADKPANYRGEERDHARHRASTPSNERPVHLGTSLPAHLGEGARSGRV
jgi:transposase-like protein